MACQSIRPLLMNFGFLVFGVTDYVSRDLTLHYGAIGAKAPRDEDVQAACRKLGRRLAEWTAVYCHGRKDEHPNLKMSERMMPGRLKRAAGSDIVFVLKFRADLGALFIHLVCHSGYNAITFHLRSTGLHSGKKKRNAGRRRSAKLNDFATFSVNKGRREQLPSFG